MIDTSLSMYISKNLFCYVQKKILQPTVDCSSYYLT